MHALKCVVILSFIKILPLIPVNGLTLQRQHLPAGHKATPSHMNAVANTSSPSTVTHTAPTPINSTSIMEFSLNSLTSLRWRKRHRKRNSNWYDYTNYNENSTMLEWSNPCDGFYDANAKQMRRPTKREQIQAYYTLKRTASNDYKTLLSSPLRDIDIDNIEIWSLHNYTYKFLPKLKMNSGIALNRWYRNMQTYVGSFGYLRRIQRKWDRSKSQPESGTALELTVLLKSSRNVLCELETTINRTQPFRKQRNRKHMPQIGRAQMDKRLKLRSKQWLECHPSDVQEADSIDLKFVKYYYYEYLRNMWKLLKEFIKRKDRSNKRNKHQYNEIDKPTRPKRRFKMRSKMPSNTNKNRHKFTLRA